MPDTLAQIPGLANPPGTGVALNQPPASLLEAITRQVTAAAATLPPHARGGLVGVATTTGVNLALVSKLGDQVSVLGWVGRSWGQPLAGGAAVQFHW